MLKDKESLKKRLNVVIHQIGIIKARDDNGNKIDMERWKQEKAELKEEEKQLKEQIKYFDKL